MNLFASRMTAEMLGDFSDCVSASAAGGSSVLSSDVQLQCFLVQETSVVELFGVFSREPTQEFKHPVKKTFHHAKRSSWQRKSSRGRQMPAVMTSLSGSAGAPP